MAETLIERHEKRRVALWNARTTEWDPHYKDVQKYVLPILGRFDQSEVNRGKKLHGDIIDDEADSALEIMVAGLSTGLTSPARPWFRLTTQDTGLMEFGPVKAWLFEVEKRMRAALQASNAYNVLPQSYTELGLFGTDLTFWLRSFKKVMRGVSVTCGEYALALDEEGEVSTAYRVMSPTTEQLAGMFGYENLPASPKAQYDRGDYYQAHEVYHGITPRHDREYGKIDGTNLPIASVYWLKGEKEPLSVSGFSERPFTGTRWNVTGMDTYGRSPAMKALGHAKQIQRMEKRRAQGEDKMISPPLVGPTALQSAMIGNVAGGITYVDGLQGQGPALRPAYEVNPNAITVMNNSQNEVRSRINRAFFADVFLMAANTDDVRTATEWAIRQEEKMLRLGPVLERVETEKLDPLVDRAFQLLLEADLLPPPPPELSGMPLKIDYISILAQAQRAVSTSSVERLTGFIGNLAAVKPDALDKFDADQAIDEYSEMLGVPPKLVRGDETVAEIRANRAQQERMAQAMETAKVGAETAKVASQADARPGSVLGALAGIG